MEVIDPADTEAIRLHLQRGYALGYDRFRKAIETQLNRRVSPDKLAALASAECRKRTLPPVFSLRPLTTAA